MAATAAAVVRIRAFACVVLPGLNDIDLGEYGFQLVAAAFRAFYSFVFTIAHRSHYVEYFAAGAFQIIKRHFINLRKFAFAYLCST